jgi:predicted alpha/beta hydrolase family esterase
MAMARRFLVLHGWQNHRPPDHWQFWLTERLRARGEQVLYPQLPSPDEPLLADWLAVVRSELRMLGHGERIVVCHSLGCLLWLRHAARMTDDEVVDRLLLVCPPSTTTLPTSLATFFPEPGDAAALARSVRRRPELVCTGGDPWCPEGAATAYGERLGLDVHVVEGAGHLSADDGYGPWPAVEHWALAGERTRRVRRRAARRPPAYRRSTSARTRRSGRGR